jgi:hypothetical protein
MARAYITHCENWNAYGVFIEKPKEKRPLGRPRNRWENNVVIELRELVILYCSILLHCIVQ